MSSEGQETLVAPALAPVWTPVELKGELLGTFTLVLGGCSAVAGSLKRQVDSNGLADPQAQGLFMNLGWTFSVVVGVLVSFDASGAHLNPAVTLSAMIHDGFNITKGLLFIAMQFLGAFLAALLTCIMFTGFPGQGKYVANFYHTGPSAETNIANAFLVEIVATAVLLYGIKFVTSGGPPKPNKFVVAYGVGTVVFFIGMNLGYMTGWSLNPARDLCPRIVRGIDLLFRDQQWQPAAGAGPFDNWNWMAPTIGPCIGGPLGVAIFKFFSNPEADKVDEASAVEMGIHTS